jgi:hypothetical protein
MGTTVGRRVLRAFLAAGAAFALIITVPGPAFAKTTSSSFVYGPDSANWFWMDQIEQAVTVEEAGVADYVRLPNPQAADTLPVAAQNGQPNKISALQFDLSRRGVITGSTVSKFVLTIAENDDLLAGFQDPTQPDLQPSFNMEGKLIQACPITGVWSSGEGAELWERAPSYEETLCVQGKRGEAGGTVNWTFDLTTLAQEWATDLSSNRGLMLVPVIPEGAATNDTTWQINLKLPQRDDGTTSGQDEYEQTKTRVDVDVAFTPPGGTQGGDNFTGGGSNFIPTGGSGTTGTEFPFGSQPVGTGGAPPAAQERTSSSRPSPTVPRLPWYVWVLIPLGLVALSTVRAVVLEPLATGKPGGVIAAIRTKNAELRGMGSRGAGHAFRRNGRSFPALISIGSLGRQGWESLSAMTARARRSLRRR